VTPSRDPARVVYNLAVAVALGGDRAADIAVLRAQPGVCGSVASDPTVSRVISDLVCLVASELVACRSGS
jgi:hypothetical protein